METDAVGSAIAPVDIPVSRTLFNGTNGTLPTERIVRRHLSLDKASTRDTHELRMHLVEHLCQVWTQSILAVLKGRREQRHDIQVYHPLAVQHQGKLRFRVISRSLQRSRVLAPLLVDSETFNSRFGI